VSPPKATSAITVPKLDDGKNNNSLARTGRCDIT
jgi:hypothetical protein